MYNCWCQTQLQLWRETTANSSFSVKAPLCAMTRGKGKRFQFQWTVSLNTKVSALYSSVHQWVGEMYIRGEAPCCCLSMCGLLQNRSDIACYLLPVWVIHWHPLMLGITEYATPVPRRIPLPHIVNAQAHSPSQMHWRDHSSMSHLTTNVSVLGYKKPFWVCHCGVYLH